MGRFTFHTDSAAEAYFDLIILAMVAQTGMTGEAALARVNERLEGESFTAADDEFFHRMPGEIARMLVSEPLRSRIIVEAAGFRLGRLTVRPFAARAGEITRIAWRHEGELGFWDAASLVRILTGVWVHPFVRSVEGMFCAIPPRRGEGGPLFRGTVRRYMERVFGLEADAYKPMLERLRIDAREIVGAYAWPMQLRMAVGGAVLTGRHFCFSVGEAAFDFERGLMYPELRESLTTQAVVDYGMAIDYPPS